MNLVTLLHRIVSNKAFRIVLMGAAVGSAKHLVAQSCGGAPCQSGADCSGYDVPTVQQDSCAYPTNNGCPEFYYAGNGCCFSSKTPLLFDLSGHGFHLSDAANGVWFRPYARKSAEFMVAWPEPGAQNGWLVLDRNGNGLVDDFSELFGDETPQPPVTTGVMKNGFRALAVYDTVGKGGNNDGWISKQDAIYGQLRIWIDSNHDGISQPDELISLKQAGIAEISLSYRESKRADANGNLFRYRSRVKDSHESDTSKVVYDVILGIGVQRDQTTTPTVAHGRDWPSSRPSVQFHEPPSFAR
jgi:hypothetical protein